MRTGLIWTVGLVSCLIGAPASAQTVEKAIAPSQAPLRKTTPVAAPDVQQENSDRVNGWTIGLAGGLLEGTFIRFAAELSKVLDDTDKLRVLPIVTYGAGENINDLLYLKGIDIAITDADVFEEYKSNKKYANIAKRINYISAIYVAEFHVYARADIKSMQDLEGKKVGFNTKGSAANITGQIAFERLGIRVEPVFINNSIALEQKKTGELAALVHAVGKPNDLFKNETGEDGFHFLPVEYSEKFRDYYVPSVLDHRDYPALIKADETIATIGVPVVLAVYNWPQGSDRFRRVERFIQDYFKRFETLREPPFHPKWREISLAAKVPGWNRYWVAENMLSTTAALRSGGFTAAEEPAVAAPVTAEDQKLYREFIDWKKKQGR